MHHLWHLIYLLFCYLWLTSSSSPYLPIAIALFHSYISYSHSLPLPFLVSDGVTNQLPHNHDQHLHPILFHYPCPRPYVILFRYIQHIALISSTLIMIYDIWFIISISVCHIDDITQWSIMVLTIHISVDHMTMYRLPFHIIHYIPTFSMIIDWSITHHSYPSPI